MSNIAVIGGTGFAQFCDGKELHSGETPFGACSMPPLLGRLGDSEFGFISRHGNPGRIPPHKVNYRANLWALAESGVKKVIAINAVGGINPAMATGSLVVPDQLIDYSYGREHSYCDGSGELLHIDFTEPFTPGLARLIADTAEALDLNCHEGGVYGVTQGPRLETAAEVRKLAADGCDIVGMTAMPEAGLARELGLEYASVCLIVNPAAGLSDEPLTLEAMHAVLEQGVADLTRLLSRLLPQL